MRIPLRKVLGLSVCLLAVAGCGEFVDDGSGGFGPPTGPTCYVDSDCVPNGCCGRGTGVVHVDDAPDCSMAMCDGSCPENQVDCGCGLTICRDGQCDVARTDGPSC